MGWRGPVPMPDSIPGSPRLLRSESTPYITLDRNAFVERVRFNKGLFAWMGFRSIGVPFDVPPRQAAAARAGAPRQLLRFGLDGIASFTTIPLRVWSYLGLVISLFAFVLRRVLPAQDAAVRADVPGFPTLIISVMFFAGVQLLSLGIIGEYLGRMYEEVKGRPLFLVSEELGIERRDAARQFVRSRRAARAGWRRATKPRSQPVATAAARRQFEDV